MKKIVKLNISLNLGVKITGLFLCIFYKIDSKEDNQSMIVNMPDLQMKRVVKKWNNKKT
ncbi:MAG: hypothetical protein Q4E81_06300 [Succinatimonas sp.]|nr:hypothetical protein [Succinatimonas sp.]